MNAEIKKKIQYVDDYRKLNFDDNFFDFILCIGVVYTLNLADIITFLKEIVRIGKKDSFINLASYESENDYWLMRDWVINYNFKKRIGKNFRIYKYKGDYSFTNSYSLNIKRK